MRILKFALEKFAITAICTGIFLCLAGLLFFQSDVWLILRWAAFILFFSVVAGLISAMVPSNNEVMYFSLGFFPTMAVAYLFFIQFFYYFI